MIWRLCQIHDLAQPPLFPAKLFYLVEVLYVESRPYQFGIHYDYGN